MDQLSFASLDFAAKKKRTKRDVFLGEMRMIVPWGALEALIEPHYPKNGPQGGRRPFPLPVMLRIYCLQQWYSLSDPGVAEHLAAQGELLEHATVFGHCYGTPRAPIDAAVAEGRDIVTDIDWQGTQQFSEKARGDIASIFVLPPSIPELERRLHTRALDDKDVIRRRMAKASGELSHWAEYDYVIINDALDHAFAEVKMILAAERMKRERQPWISAYVRRLQAKL